MTEADKPRSQSQKEALSQEGSERAKQLAELARTNLEEPDSGVITLLRWYLQPECAYAFEQTLVIEGETETDHVSSNTWHNLSDGDKNHVLGVFKEVFDVPLTGTGSPEYEEKVVRRFQAEGEPDTISEGPIQVTVLKTKFPEIHIHASQYTNPELGTQYSLVRAPEETALE